MVALDIPFEQLRNHVAALRFSSGSTGSYGFLMDENLEIFAHPNPAAEGMDMHDIPIQDAEFEDARDKLENALEFGGPPLEYDMEDAQERPMVAFSAKLSNGWILTLVTPLFEYFYDMIWMQILLYALGLVLTAVLVSMLRRLDKRTKERDAQLSKLTTVTQNYKGIVWSVDNKNVLTTLRGEYIGKMGLDPISYEGGPIASIQAALQVNFTMYIRKTRTEGPQDWVFERNGITYHSYMAPMHDEKGRIIGIVGSIDDVTAQTNLQQELENALAEAEIANKAKSSFLANMSHEIRTPMNAILGITEILVQDETLPPDIMEGLTKISSSGSLLLGIINDVLDFSKIEAGKLDIRPAPYEVASLVNDSMHLNMMRIGSKPIDFLLEIDENIPSKLIGDELRIKQILNNLLSNAFKYTDAGAVTLRIGFEAAVPAEADEGTLILGVRDTGHGMTRQQLDKLFDEYSRFQTGSLPP